MTQKVVVSRYDRLGDLVLTLPAIAHLKRSGIEKVFLHTSPYAKAIGEWAQFNGICDFTFSSASEFLALDQKVDQGLSFFHCPESVSLFRDLKIRHTFGTRSRLSALWSYSKSLAQHRSRVLLSEMEYNVELAKSFLSWRGLQSPEFLFLEPLKIPSHWVSERKSPDLVIVLSNGGSAKNWPVSEYVRVADSALSLGKNVDFLVQGWDAQARKSDLEASGVLQRGAQFVGLLSSIESLIVYLSKAGEVVASSTGPLHIAHAASVPVTGIYPLSPKVQSFQRWRPHGYRHSAPVKWISIS